MLGRYVFDGNADDREVLRGCSISQHLHLRPLQVLRYEVLSEQLLADLHRRLRADSSPSHL